MSPSISLSRFWIISPDAEEAGGVPLDVGITLLFGVVAGGGVLLVAEEQPKPVESSVEIHVMSSIVRTLSPKCSIVELIINFEY